MINLQVREGRLYPLDLPVPFTPTKDESLELHFSITHLFLNCFSYFKNASSKDLSIKILGKTFHVNKNSYIEWKKKHPSVYGFELDANITSTEDLKKELTTIVYKTLDKYYFLSSLLKKAIDYTKSKQVYQWFLAETNETIQMTCFQKIATYQFIQSSASKDLKNILEKWENHSTLSSVQISNEVNMEELALSAKSLMNEQLDKEICLETYLNYLCSYQPRVNKNDQKIFGIIAQLYPLLFGSTLAYMDKTSVY